MKVENEISDEALAAAGHEFEMREALANAMKDNVVRVVVVKHNQDGQEAANLTAAPEGMTNLAIQVMGIFYNLTTGETKQLTAESAPPSADDFINGSRDDMDEISVNAVIGLADDIRRGAFKSQSGSETNEISSNAYLRMLMEVLSYPREVIANILASMLMGCVEPMIHASDEEYAEIVEAMRAEMIMPKASTS